MSNNLVVAEQYARQMAAMTRVCWTSDNLPQLSRYERKQVLKIYKKHFKTVEYDADTGVCRCWVIDPCDTSGMTHTRAYSWDEATGVGGGEIKDSTLQGKKLNGDKTVMVINSDREA
jgi:hypothetical protein